MRALNAYKRQQDAAPPRVDLILTLYRKALEQLDRAGSLLREGNSAAAQAPLTKASLIVASLGAGMTASAGAGFNFLRLYEFVTRQLAGGTLENIEAARRVLIPLREAFEAIRDQAVALESQGQIPALDRQVQVTI